MSDTVISVARVRGVPQHSWQDHLVTWWHEVDRVLLCLVLILMAFGTVAVAAASPASAQRLSSANHVLDPLYFFYLHLRWQLVGLIVMFALSALPREMARRLGIVLAGGMLVALVLVLVVGTEVNGAHRWLNIGFSLQPSAFMMPGFAITLAWMLSWRVRDPGMPVIEISFVAFAVVAGLLLAEPDFGSTVLLAAIWFVLALLAGLAFKRIAILGTICIVGLGAIYVLYDNARHRIDTFLGGGTAYDQVDLAQRTLLSGGWSGSGLWLGVRKMSLPEAHTDYIFSVIGEEFGLIVCAALVMLYLAIVIRALRRLKREEDLFAVLATVGLVTQVAAGAFIHILVNLQMLPAKGLPLPAVSYGGSSTIAICMTFGLLLAITRRNPFLNTHIPGLALYPGSRK